MGAALATAATRQEYPARCLAPGRTGVPSTDLLRGLVLALLCDPGSAALAAGEDSRRGMLVLDRMEFRDGDGDPKVLEVEGWYGDDRNAFWLKSNNEYADGAWAGAEQQAGWRRAITPHWDFKLGARADILPDPSRHWAVIGFEGSAWGIDVDTTLYAGESGRTGLRLKAGYEWSLSPKLALAPDLEINAHGENDAATGTGSGLSDLSLGVRLFYTLTETVTPYIGLSWDRSFGNTADFAREEGDGPHSTQLQFGIRAWF